MSEDYLDTLSERYDRTVERIRSACLRIGRNPDDITLVAVSKTFPPERIRALYDLGHRDFGENKVQDLVRKEEALRSAGLCPEIRWHFIGHLQRNKINAVLGRFSLFHSLDSERLADAVNRRAEQGVNVVNCLAQVNISEQESKFGVQPQDAVAFVRSLSTRRHIRVHGLMGMARPTTDIDQLRSDFSRLRLLRDEVSAQSPTFSGSGILSMGMSHDFEIAIEEGATHVRVGSAIFGARDKN